MYSNILLGPILGIESNEDYTICLLSKKSVNQVSILIDGVAQLAEKIDTTASGIFWRVSYTPQIADTSQSILYSIKVDNQEARDQNERILWSFHVPSHLEAPKISYTSCNGFSDDSYKNNTSSNYRLWDKMKKEHESLPFSLMLMGGDQLYADSIWSSVKSLEKWLDLPREEKVKRKATKEMHKQIDIFYDKLYRSRWSSSSMSLMLSSIPSVMMWDDHDIFDGWGSYPKDLQECNVYQCIYSYAKKYFELYQIRSKNNKSLINPNVNHYAFSFSFRQYHIMAIDNRSERTIEQVMSKEQWTDIIARLELIPEKEDLLFLTAVPVVYRDFSFTEGVLDITPMEEELTDDLKDHWRAKEHQTERAKLIMNLLANAKQRKAKTVILSGDVHVGCLGVINDKRDNVNPIKIHQIVSSGIVHPPPTIIAWYGIMAVTNDRDEYLNEDHSIKISMLQPHASNKYIRSRNFVTLEHGTDNKLWVNWMCEHKDKPIYPLE